MVDARDERPAPTLDYGTSPRGLGLQRLRRIAARVVGWSAVIVAAVGVLCGVISGNFIATPDFLLLAFGLGVATIFIRHGNVRL
jgi:hypothetical protein